MSTSEELGNNTCFTLANHQSVSEPPYFSRYFKDKLVREGRLELPPHCWD